MTEQPQNTTLDLNKELRKGLIEYKLDELIEHSTLIISLVTLNYYYSDTKYLLNISRLSNTYDVTTQYIECNSDKEAAVLATSIYIKDIIHSILTTAKEKYTLTYEHNKENIATWNKNMERIHSFLTEGKGAVNAKNLKVLTIINKNETKKIINGHGGIYATSTDEEGGILVIDKKIGENNRELKITIDSYDHLFNYKGAEDLIDLGNKIGKLFSKGSHVKSEIIRMLTEINIAKVSILENDLGKYAFESDEGGLAVALGYHYPNLPDELANNLYFQDMVHGLFYNIICPLLTSTEE
jgi:hypothetical protein